MTYTSLRNRVISYLDRDDAATTERIKDFIEDAQYMLANSCKTIGQEFSVFSHFIPGISVYQKPAGWIRNISINVGDLNHSDVKSILSLQTYEFIRNYSPNTADESKRGLPLFYADYTYSNFVVAPAPDLAYPFEFIYMGAPPFISETGTQTNWWTNFAPNVLFSAVMTEAMFFLENYERASAYEAKTAKGIQAINTQDEMRMVDRATARQAD
jgi:hypothetical protein